MKDAANEVKHTPTPWHYAPGELIYGPKGESVASCRFVTNFKAENVENMRLIVRAVNAHDHLVAALAAILKQAHKHEVQYWLDAEGTDAEKLLRIVALCRDALTQAEAVRT